MSSDSDSGSNYKVRNESTCIECSSDIECSSEIECSSDIESVLDAITENDSDTSDTNDSSLDSSFDSDYENRFFDDSDFNSESDSVYTDSEMDIDSQMEIDSEMDIDSYMEVDSVCEYGVNDIPPDYSEDHFFLQQEEGASSTTNVTQEETRSFLRNWVMEYNINHQPMNPLLRFLQRTWQNLCIDVRTLMKTPKMRDVVDMPPGKYVHLGIKSSLDLLLSKINVDLVPDRLMLTFNIDGVPLSRSSNNGFWLILGRIENIETLRKHIFVVGVYYGDKKPGSIELLLI